MGEMCAGGGKVDTYRKICPRLLAGFYVIIAPGCWTGGGCRLKALCVFPGGALAPFLPEHNKPSR